MVRLARGVVWDRRGPGIRLVVAAALPWLATAVAALPPLRSSRSAASAGFIYLFAVVGASLVAGLRGGLVASLLSALGLNFFFVPREVRSSVPGERIC